MPQKIHDDVLIRIRCRSLPNYLQRIEMGCFADGRRKRPIQLLILGSGSREIRAPAARFSADFSRTSL